MNKKFKDKELRDGKDIDNILSRHTSGYGEPQSMICTGNAEYSLLKAGMDSGVVQG